MQHTLGFTAYQGRTGRPWTKPFALQRAAIAEAAGQPQAAEIDRALQEL